MERRKVSRQLLKRLPLYLNYLKSLPENAENISSTTIAKALELGDVQVRKDLARVSDGGRRRTGHPREKLIQDIEDFLNFATTGAVVVGGGKLGRALMDYQGFEKAGIDLMAGFDICPPADSTVCGKPIYPIDCLESFCQSHDIRIAIITVPAESAQKVCDRLVACNIKAIWNFAPVRLIVPDDVVVKSENLAVSLTALRLQLKPKKPDTEEITE